MQASTVAQRLQRVAANGSYFSVVGQLIVPESGIAVMTAAIRELVRSGDITTVGIRCDDRD